MSPGHYHIHSMVESRIVLNRVNVMLNLIQHPPNKEGKTLKQVQGDVIFTLGGAGRFRGIVSRSKGDYAEI